MTAYVRLVVPEEYYHKWKLWVLGEHKIYYETIQGLSHTFTGNVKCLGHTTNY